MGKKTMKLPLLFKPPTEITTSPSSWPWNLTCSNPKTLSFRATINDEILKPGSSEAIDNGGEESVEKIIRGLRSSERLFFEPGETSSILEEAKADAPALFKESVMVAMDSSDPFADFRRSMEEMVEAHGLKDWDCLEELLTCYLRVNGRSNHGYIVGAFVDLLVGLAFASISSSSSSSSSDDHCCKCSSSAANSFTSPLSFSSNYSTSTSPCLSSLEAEDEIEKSIDNASSSSLSNVSSSNI